MNKPRKLKMARENYIKKRYLNFESELGKELLDYEGVTKYGEFITSYFYWLGPTRQKEIADRLNNIPKK